MPPVPAPPSVPPSIAIPSAAPLLVRLNLVGGLRGVAAPPWGLLVSLFADAEAVLLLGPIGDVATAVLEQSPPGIHATFPLPTLHPLRRAWSGSEPVHWHRGRNAESVLNGEAGAIPELPRMVQRLDREYRVLPVEVLAIPVGGGRVLARVAFDPDRCATPEDLAIAWLVAQLPKPSPAQDNEWLASLAQSLVGVTDSTALLTHALGALTDLAPGTLGILYRVRPESLEVLPVAWTAGVEATVTAPLWHLAGELMRAAMTAGRPLRIADRISGTPPPQAAAELASLPTARTLAFWPLSDQGVPTGMLVLGHPEAGGLAALEPAIATWQPLVGRAYRTAEVVQRLAQDQERRRAELGMAATVQRSLLPEPLVTGGWNVVCHHASDHELAGDFVLVEESRELLHVAIGDVSGRGIPASLTMMAAYSLLLAHLSRLTQLAPAMASWSGELARLSERNQDRGGDITYTTAAVARIVKENGEVQFVKAGHPYPLHYRAASATVDRWDAAGYPAGLFADQTFEVVSTTLAPGDALVLYTDGYSEANAGRGQLGLERMEDLLGTFGLFPAPVIQDQLLVALEGHLRGQAVGDDTTLLVVTRDSGEWQHRAAVPTLKLAEFAIAGCPALLKPAKGAATELIEAWEALQAGIIAMDIEAPAAGWRMRCHAGERTYQAAIQIPKLREYLPESTRPSLCLARLGSPDHPWRGFAKRVDFCWVHELTSELCFVRRW